MTPEEEQVRRALASLPAPGSMPPEVAARLDARLEELRAERGTGAGGSEDPARQSRRWPTVLLAAAVLAVVGVGVGSVVTDLGPGSMESMTAGDAAGEAGAEPPRPMEVAPGAEAPKAEGSYSAAQSLVTDRMVLTAERLRLDSDTLRRDVVEVVDLRLPRAAADDEVHSDPDQERTAGQRLGRLFSPCVLPLTGNGDQLLAVRLDGEPATLVLRAPEDGARVAQIYSCDDPSAVLAHVQVDAR